MKSRFLVIFLCFVLWGIPSGAQNVAIKTNLLYDLTTTVNGDDYYLTIDKDRVHTVVCR